MRDDEDEKPTPVDSPLGIARTGTRRRLQSATEREHDSELARREREARERDTRTKDRERDYDYPHEIPEDITGQYQGEELDNMRDKREPTDRIRHLEKRVDHANAQLIEAGRQIGALAKSQDELAGVVLTVSTNVAEIRGEMKVIPELVSVLKTAAIGASERDKIVITTQAEVQRTEAISAAEVHRAQAMEPIEAKRDRRGWITTVLAILMTITAGVLALMQAGKC